MALRAVSTVLTNLYLPIFKIQTAIRAIRLALLTSYAAGCLSEYILQVFHKVATFFGNAFFHFDQNSLIRFFHLKSKQSPVMLDYERGLVVRQNADGIDPCFPIRSRMIYFYESIPLFCHTFRVADFECQIAPVFSRFPTAITYKLFHGIFTRKSVLVYLSYDIHKWLSLLRVAMVIHEFTSL